MNLVERWFALPTARRLRRGVHPNVLALKTVTPGYLAVMNEDPELSMWTKTAECILASVDVEDFDGVAVEDGDDWAGKVRINYKLGR